MGVCFGRVKGVYTIINVRGLNCTYLNNTISILTQFITQRSKQATQWVASGIGVVVKGIPKVQFNGGGFLSYYRAQATLWLELYSCAWSLDRDDPGCFLVLGLKRTLDCAVKMDVLTTLSVDIVGVHVYVVYHLKQNLALISENCL